ncbi:MAG TPA: ATP-dependent DNA ligase [Gemmatimonadaceae bacterium]|nr:ATP-dependent DNA ligase [Gemmatimonadaceae bacterium]
MKLDELAARFDELEGTSSRMRMVELVADVLRRAAPDERHAVAYLLQAQLRPPYEGVQIGLGERLLARAVAEVYGTTEAAVARRLARSGDLGLVAESLAPPPPRRRLTVREGYDALLELARVAGAGSQQRKGELLAALLRKAGGREAKLLVRVAQGRLRLGVGDQTILEGAALGALGDRRKKKLLEHAYNVRSDIGDIVATAFGEGEAALEKMGPEVGVPVRPELAQRLPSAEAIIERLGEVQAEPKYDGFRLQLHRDGDEVRVFSRRLENVTGMFPELVKGVCRQLRTTRAIIEGEAVVHDPETGEFLPFQVTMTRKRKNRVEEMAGSHPMRLFAFDLLYAGRRSCLALSQRERSAKLRELLPSGPDDPVAVTEAIVTGSAGELERFFDEMIEHGLEGVVAKRLDAPYQAGARGYDWVKLKRAYQSKLRDTVDVVLVGYLRGRGKRAALGIGSLLAAVYDPRRDRFRTVAKIGSGLSDAAWRELRARLDERAVRHRPARVESLITPDVWVEPALVVEVLADEITRSPFHTAGKEGDAPGYALRFPRVVNGVRADKAPEDATTEREILDMYRQQRAPAGSRKRGAGPAASASGASASGAAPRRRAGRRRG